MIKPRSALFKWRHFEPEIIVCAVRWYLRFSLSYRDVEELLMERGLPADHSTIWRWVQRYAPELNKRCRRELKPTNGSWRVDETYICQGGSWRYLYRAVDSTGATVDFWLSAVRDAAAAKQFFQRALQAPGHPRPRVITVDGNPSYPKVIAELKQERKLGRRCRCRTCPYLNGSQQESVKAADFRALLDRAGFGRLSVCQPTMTSPRSWAGRATGSIVTRSTRKTRL
jgi:transposase, IS6 family